MTPQPPSHLPVLDGVRGLAILLVFAFHCFPLPNGTFLPLDILLTLKGSFWFGVDLFFVLSGFLITGILIDSRGASNRLSAFYARRTLRIFPLYYFGLLVAFAAWSLNPVIHGEIERTAPLPWFLAYAFNVYIGIHQSWPESAILNHFWTLCVEEQFYLVWPFLIWATSDRRLPLMMAATITVAIAVKATAFFLPLEPVTLATSMPGRMDSFAAGGLVAWMVRHYTAESIIPRARACFYLSGVILAAVAFPSRGLHLDSPAMLVAVPPLLAVFFASLIYLSIHPTGEFHGLAAALRIRVLRWLGTYSYGIYVYHWLVYFVLVRSDAFGWKQDSAWVNTALTAILTLVLSWLSFRYLESPFLRLKDRFTAKNLGPPSEPGTNARG